MIQHAWVRRTLLGAYVMLVTFVLAHSINAFVSHSLTISMDSIVPVMAPHTTSPDSYDVTALAESVLAARLFPLPPGAAGTLSSILSGSAEAATPSAPPLNVAKTVLLLGTAVNSSSGEVAILEDVASKKQTLYHLQETVPTVGTIAQIEKDRVLFRQGSQEEWLNLAIGKLSSGFEHKLSASVQSGPPRTASLRSVSLPVAQVSTKSRRPVDRQILIETANDTSRLYQHARPIPFAVNGRSEGILLEAVNHYSFYGQLGFQSGDVLKRINGVELRDPSTFISLFQQLKDERTIQIDILRNDQPKTLAIDVQ